MKVKELFRMLGRSPNQSPHPAVTIRVWRRPISFSSWECRRPDKHRFPRGSRALSSASLDSFLFPDRKTMVFMPPSCTSTRVYWLEYNMSSENWNIRGPDYTTEATQEGTMPTQRDVQGAEAVRSHCLLKALRPAAAAIYEQAARRPCLHEDLSHLLCPSPSCAALLGPRFRGDESLGSLAPDSDCTRL
ncbi:hypothetical protein COCON_G00126650 [Conger conger]|uniref:Uncharacterized protein n=1 Tax=Conger conger TaxID=82655 RepID=A0A9Q1DD02_CONCO|nr:hypothetical protein COCON_G00126650 [Conger conger]